MRAAKEHFNLVQKFASAADGSITALLGASPGAYTAVSVMLEVIKKCFPQHLKASTKFIIQLSERLV